PVGGALAAELLVRLPAADEDPDLGEALDRWELSLFQDGPFGAEQLRESLVALLGGTDGLWAAVVRGSILLGETPRERADVQERLAEDPEPDVVRRGPAPTATSVHVKPSRAATPRSLSPWLRVAAWASCTGTTSRNDGLNADTSARFGATSARRQGRIGRA